MHHQTNYNMPIPTFQEIMLPYLQCFVDGQVHHRNEFQDKLAKHFDLSDEEVNRTYSAKDRKVFWDRTQWAKTFLTKAYLLEQVSRGELSNYSTRVGSISN